MTGDRRPSDFYTVRATMALVVHGDMGSFPEFVDLFIMSEELRRRVGA